MTRLLLFVLCGCGGGRPHGGAEDAAAPGEDASAADAAAADAAIGDAASDAAPTACGPTAGGPFWVLEGEGLSVQVSCASGEPLAGDAFVVGPLPEGASYDSATGVLSWTPGLDQAAVYDLAVRVPARGEEGALRIGVLDRWSDPGNVAVIDPAAYTEEYGLPVFHLEVDPAINADDYTPAIITFRGHRFAGEAKYRGGASLGYPKLSFTLKFTEEDLFAEPGSGFLARRKVVLTSTFDDNSYVRQRMAFELWNRLDPEHLQIRQASAVVFVNGEYRGLYALTDHVDRFLLEAQGLSPDGNLYKAIDHDANFRLVSVQNGGLPKVTLHDGYEKKEGLPLDVEPGGFADLEDLVAFVATASDEDFLAELPVRLDQRDYEDWWIFVSFIQADDSAGKNSYHYHDPAGGPWRYAPWDFNNSFGQTWQSDREAWNGAPEDFVWANEIFTRMLAEPAVGPALRARYGDVLDGPFALDALTALHDEMQAEVRDSALRDEERWAAEYRSYGGWSWRNNFTSYEEEVEYVGEWLQDRWQFVDGLY